MIFKQLTTTDKIAYLFLLGIFGLGIYISMTDIVYFDEVYTKEDGLIEYGTAFLLLCSSVLLIYRLFKLQKDKQLFWKLGIFGMALVFLFGAGEEISWGQRIFDVESSTFFMKNNAQGETNLHNLVIDEKKVNKLIFSQLLTIILVLYLIITPFLYRKVKFIKNLATRFAIPIVKWHHTIFFLLITALLLLIESDRKWELYELAFGLIFLLIFLNPLNKNIYTSG